MTSLSSTQTEKLMTDLRLVVADAEELLRATAGQAGEGAAEVRTKVEASLARAREGLSQVQEATVAKAKAAGVGVVVGVLIGRR